jgi:hypothetical protein
MGVAGLSKNILIFFSKKVARLILKNFISLDTFDWF